MNEKLEHQHDEQEKSNDKERRNSQEREGRRKTLEAMAGQSMRQVNIHLLEYISIVRMLYAEGFITEKQMAQDIDKANRRFL